MSDIEQLRATVERLAGQVRALEDQVEIMQLVAQDSAADRFWVARVSANTWKWVRTPAGWRIADRVNAPLDGTPEHREMLAPPDKPPAGDQ
jgi:hypothetical protein